MIYRISNFDDGPHWDSALVEAETPEAATAVLQTKLVHDEDGFYPDTVWSPRPPGEWVIAQAESPVLFLLGCGCR